MKKCTECGYENYDVAKRCNKCSSWLPIQSDVENSTSIIDNSKENVINRKGDKTPLNKDTISFNNFYNRNNNELFLCNNCNVSINQNMKYCPECGHKIILMQDSEKIKNELDNNKSKEEPSILSLIYNILNIMWTIFIVGIILLVIVGFITYRSQKSLSIELTQKSDLLEHGRMNSDVLNEYVNDYDYENIYGWEARIVTVNPITFFVSYGVDNDNDQENGYEGFFFEVTTKNRVIKFINDNSKLTEKYKLKGYLQ